MTRPAPLTWRRDPATWKYHATAPNGDRWHVVQASSRRWDVCRNGRLFADWPSTLADAKWAAEQEADPVARERAAAMRREREARRAARSAS